MKRFLFALLIVFISVSTAWSGAYVTDDAYTAAVAVVGTSTQLDLTSDSSTPTNLTNSLGSVAVTAGDGNGDFVVADGDVSGKKITLLVQEVTASGTGTIRHWVLSLSGVIKAAGTLTEKAISSGSVYQFPEKNVYEVNDAQ